MENNTISAIPAELRPYEKCEACGPEALSDHELLAVIIRTGTGNMSSVALAKKLLYPQGERIGLNSLLNASIDELKSVKGIGRVKAVQLKCLGELCRRISRETAEERLNFENAESVAAYYMQSLRELSEQV